MKGEGEEEKKTKHREEMAKEVSAAFAERSEVGASGHHLFESKEKVLWRSLQSQKAWIKSVRVEISRERQNRSEAWKHKFQQRNMDQLFEIKQQAPKVARRQQQTLCRYWA